MLLVPQTQQVRTYLCVERSECPEGPWPMVHGGRVRQMEGTPPPTMYRYIRHLPLLTTRTWRQESSTIQCRIQLEVGSGACESHLPMSPGPFLFILSESTDELAVVAVHDTTS